MFSINLPIVFETMDGKHTTKNGIQREMTNRQETFAVSVLDICHFSKFFSHLSYKKL